MENEQVEWKMNKNLWGHTATSGPQGPLTLSKCAGGGAPGPYAGLGAAMAAELMIGFWFGIGAILGIKMVNSLEELISRK